MAPSDATVQVVVDVKMRLSLWDALKMRIAGVGQAELANVRDAFMASTAKRCPWCNLPESAE
jgi:hypothetical protein